MNKILGIVIVLAITCTIFSVMVVQEQNHNHLLTSSVYQTKQEGDRLRAGQVQRIIERQIHNSEREISQRVNQEMGMGQPSVSEIVVSKQK